MDSDFCFEWYIFKILLSGRGYIIVQLRQISPSYFQDTIVVYSINGVMLVIQKLDEILNDMVIEPTTEYFIITGGSKGILKQISIITMEKINLIKIENKFPCQIMALNFIDNSKIVISLSNYSMKCIEWKSNGFDIINTKK